jgi:hypothetical protein
MYEGSAHLPPSPLSRPEAIRRLVAMALKSTRKGGKTGR